VSDTTPAPEQDPAHDPATGSPDVPVTDDPGHGDEQVPDEQAGDADDPQPDTQQE
jgi:hypothetical protein